MPKIKVNQTGVINPIILIIILTIIIATILGMGYKSNKEGRLKSDKTANGADTTNATKTTENTRSGGSSASTSNNKELAKESAVELANSTKLAEKAVELKVDNKIVSSPKFSIIPPAGWEKFPPSGKKQVEFLSPSIDIAKEGNAFLKIQPNITVFILKENFKDLDEATAVLEKSIASSTYQKNKQKTTINGEEAYIIEFTTDITSSLRKEMEEQLKQIVATSGAKVSEETLRNDMNKLLQKTKTKLLSYSFYKNGYYINAVGRSLESFWDQHSFVIKASLDTFKLE